MFIPNLMLWIGMAMSDHSWIPRTTKANFSPRYRFRNLGHQEKLLSHSGLPQISLWRSRFFLVRLPWLFNKKTGEFFFFGKGSLRMVWRYGLRRRFDEI